MNFEPMTFLPDAGTGGSVLHRLASGKWKTGEFEFPCAVDGWPLGRAGKRLEGVLSRPFPVVEVDCLSDVGGDWACLIVPAATGVLYSNQTGGGLCSHPRVEGFLVPLPGLDYRNVAHLVERWLNVTAEDLDKLDENFKRDGYPLKADRAKILYPDRDDDGYDSNLNDDAAWTSEAWVWVTVTGDKDLCWSGLDGRSAVLAYTNSD